MKRFYLLIAIIGVITVVDVIHATYDSKQFDKRLKEYVGKIGIQEGA